MPVKYLAFVCVCGVCMTAWMNEHAFLLLNKHANTWTIPDSHTTVAHKTYMLLRLLSRHCPEDHVSQQFRNLTKKLHLSQPVVKTEKLSFSFHGNVIPICLCLCLIIQFKPVSVYQSDRSSLYSRSQNIIHVTSHHCVHVHVYVRAHGFHSLCVFGCCVTESR